jgi:hypothetical protein
MPDERWDSLLTEGARSLEVRWIFPGPMRTALAAWFGRFPAEMESRQDNYLLDPRWRGPSVKFRGGCTLEVKMYQGSPGILDVAGRACGRMESWQKWSFPSGPLSHDCGDQACRRPVGKRRRISRFGLANGRIVTHAASLVHDPRGMRIAGMGAWRSPARLAPGTNGASGADESGEQGLQFQLGFLQFGPGPGSGHDADAGVHRGVVAVYVS